MIIPSTHPSHLVRHHPSRYTSPHVQPKVLPTSSPPRHRTPPHLNDHFSQPAESARNTPYTSLHAIIAHPQVHKNDNTKNAKAENISTLQRLLKKLEVKVAGKCHQPILQRYHITLTSKLATHSLSFHAPRPQKTRHGLPPHPLPPIDNHPRHPPNDSRLPHELRIKPRRHTTDDALVLALERAAGAGHTRASP